MAGVVLISIWFSLTFSVQMSLLTQLTAISVSNMENSELLDSDRFGMRFCPWYLKLEGALKTYVHELVYTCLPVHKWSKTS